MHSILHGTVTHIYIESVGIVWLRHTHLQQRKCSHCMAPTYTCTTLLYCMAPSCTCTEIIISFFHLMAPRALCVQSFHLITPRALCVQFFTIFFDHFSRRIFFSSQSRTPFDSVVPLIFSFLAEINISSYSFHTRFTFTFFFTRSTDTQCALVKHSFAYTNSLTQLKIRK